MWCLVQKVLTISSRHKTRIFLLMGNASLKSGLKRNKLGIVNQNDLDVTDPGFGRVHQDQER